MSSDFYVERRSQRIGSTWVSGESSWDSWVSQISWKNTTKVVNRICDLKDSAGGRGVYGMCQGVCNIPCPCRQGAHPLQKSVFYAFEGRGIHNFWDGCTPKSSREGVKFPSSRLLFGSWIRDEGSTPSLEPLVRLGTSFLRSSLFA